MKNVFVKMLENKTKKIQKKLLFSLLVRKLSNIILLKFFTHLIIIIKIFRELYLSFCLRQLNVQFQAIQPTDWSKTENKSLSNLALLSRHSLRSASFRLAASRPSRLPPTRKVWLARIVIK